MQHDDNRLYQFLQMVTLKDISQATGFSEAVVSRALKACPDRPVAAKTREAIHRMAQRLGYSPNHAASLLARGRNPSIGFFLPNYADELAAQLACGLTDAANEQGLVYNLHFDIASDLYETFVNRAAAQRSVALATYLPSNYTGPEVPECLRRLEQSNCSIVVMNAPVAESARLHSIIIDNELGGRLAAQRFLATGCRSFLHAQITGSRQLSARCRGFLAALREAGADAYEVPDGFLGEGLRCPENARAVVSRLSAAAAPIGYFACSDQGALALYRLLQRAGRAAEIGDRIRVIGFNDSTLCKLCEPELTSIRQPFRELGIQTVHCLCNDFLDTHFPIQSRLAPQLVLRASG
jgi:DNA-binding LacI/PurR family transcriptional regulator